MTSKIFVTGINPAATNNLICNYFKKLSDQTISAKIIKQNQKGVLAVVHLKTPQAAQKIIDDVSYQTVDGKMLIAQFANLKENKPRYNVVVNFPPSFDMSHITERYIYLVLRQFGPIKRILLQKQQRVAFCEFYDAKSAEKAVSCECADGVCLHIEEIFSRNDKFAPYIPKNSKEIDSFDIQNDNECHSSETLSVQM